MEIETDQKVLDHLRGNINSQVAATELLKACKLLLGSIGVSFEIPGTTVKETDINEQELKQGMDRIVTLLGAIAAGGKLNVVKYTQEKLNVKQ